MLRTTNVTAWIRASMEEQVDAEMKNIPVINNCILCEQFRDIHSTGEGSIWIPVETLDDESIRFQ